MYGNQIRLACKHFLLLAFNSGAGLMGRILPIISVYRSMTDLLYDILSFLDWHILCARCLARLNGNVHIFIVAIISVFAENLKAKCLASCIDPIIQPA